MSGRETPATKAARDAGVEFAVHEYAHDPGADSYALEAAGALGLEPGRVFKTLVADRQGELVVCIVPSDRRLDTRALGKRVEMARAGSARWASGGGWPRSSTRAAWSGRPCT
jgi:Cys-tRNA(Pro)/Cys-tRNA(Cys) deacylase